MHAQYSIINNGSDGHEIKTPTKFCPQGYCIPSLALIKKPISSVDSLTFMVTSQQIKLIRKFNFKSE